MKKILRFLKGQEVWVVLILLLLLLQATCDLALPRYTSDILNVGLQQGGIASPVPETLRAERMDDLALFLSEEEQAKLQAAYGSKDDQGIRHLNPDADREALSQLLSLPESALYQMASSGQGPSLEKLRNVLQSGLFSQEQLIGEVKKKAAEFKGLKTGYLEQVAIRFVANEYEAQGLDLHRIQNRYLWSVGLKMLGMALVMSLSSVLTGLIAAWISAKVGKNLREAVFENVMRFTGAEIEKFSTASLITRSTNDIQQVQMVLVLLLRMVAYAPILAVFGIVRVLETHSGMGWIIVLAVALLSVCVGTLMGVAMPRFRRMQILVDRLNLVSRELLTGVMPIRAFNREAHESERFKEANMNLFSTQLFTQRTMTFMMPILMFIMNGVSVLIVWVGASKVDLGTIQVGDLTAFITYSMMIVMSFLMLSMVSIILPRAGVAAGRIQEVLDTSVELRDPDKPRDVELRDGGKRLAFQNVSFHYPQANDNAVSHLSFTAEPGQVTAIIGSTGCGKSTLLNLIPRFFDVSEGSITLDGIDIRELSQKTLREQIGYVPQKGRLFSGTIESNLKYAGESISDADMKEAARIAQALPFIEEKEEGYQSAISQEGSNVSGGQRQRLAIARAIAKHPRIYLFDDAFSALDYKTDLALRTELAKICGEATVLIVAQRISTVLRADKILCMEDGKIVGQGTHAELMKQCRAYQEIAGSQLSDDELAALGGER